MHLSSLDVASAQLTELPFIVFNSFWKDGRADPTQRQGWREKEKERERERKRERERDKGRE